MTYTISIADIITQIWNDGHPDETHSIWQFPKWSDKLADIDTKIEYARPLIFSFNYSCYGDDEDKKHLEQQILRKYLTREICCSSITRWQLFLYSRLNEIMPRYVALYNANLQVIENAINVLNPYNITETKDRNTKSSSEDTSSTTTSNNTTNKNNYEDNNTNKVTGVDDTVNNTTTKYSDTPQALMETDKDYLTNLTKVEVLATDTYSSNTESANTGNSEGSSTMAGSSSSNGSGSETKSDNYVKTIKGNMSKYNMGELLDSYANSIMSIEELITNDLADLFYQLY